MKTTPSYSPAIATLPLWLVPLVSSGCGAFCLQVGGDSCCAQAGESCAEDADCCSGQVCRQDGLCVGEVCDTTSSSGGADGAQLPDPSAGYCTRLGGEYRIEEGVDGQVGICVLPDGTERDTWELYCGDCFDRSACGPGN